MNLGPAQKNGQEPQQIQQMSKPQQQGQQQPQQQQIQRPQVRQWQPPVREQQQQVQQPVQQQAQQTAQSESSQQIQRPQQITRPQEQQKPQQPTRPQLDRTQTMPQQPLYRPQQPPRQQSLQRPQQQQQRQQSINRQQSQNYDNQRSDQNGSDYRSGSMDRQNNMERPFRMDRSNSMDRPFRMERSNSMDRSNSMERQPAPPKKKVDVEAQFFDKRKKDLEQQQQVQQASQQFQEGPKQELRRPTMRPLQPQQQGQQQQEQQPQAPQQELRRPTLRRPSMRMPQGEDQHRDGMQDGGHQTHAPQQDPRLIEAQQKLQERLRNQKSPKDRQEEFQKQKEEQEKEAKLRKEEQIKQAEAKKEQEKKDKEAKLEQEKKFENVKDLLEARRRARSVRRQDRRSNTDDAEKDDLFEVGEEGMSVVALAQKLAVSESQVITKLFVSGIMAQMNQILDKNTVKWVANEFGADVLDREELNDQAAKTNSFISEEDLDMLKFRPPVVTVMGHVDHGKTSLLDYIRKSRVAAGEAGGITQAIGAYNVELKYEEELRSVCFLDTPGHQAFSAMRARGTKVTDLAVIIVACDDGVQPQTIEAVNHAKAAQVPIVVALNKIDREGASIEKTKQDLSSKAELLPEEWGGEVPMIPISAKKGTGVDILLETIILVSELAELQANPKALAKGTIIEAHLDKQRGPVVTMIVQNGTLRVGDIVSAGPAYGKIRQMTDDMGKNTDEAPPSKAVQAYGLDAVPGAGDIFAVFRSLQEAQEQATIEAGKLREKRLAELSGGNRVTLTSYATNEKDSQQRLNLVLKADAQGSVEAVKAALLGLPQENVLLRFLHTGPGDITQADVDLIAASKGLLLSFNLQPSENVLAYAKMNKVTLKNYNIIYEIIDDIRAAMEGKLRLVENRESIGKAVVKAKFGSGAKAVGGCMVEEGRVEKNCFIVVKRKNKSVFEGKLVSLKRFKDDVQTVQSGVECGIATPEFSDWQEGDRIESFSLTMKRRTLEEAQEDQQLELEMVAS